VLPIPLDKIARITPIGFNNKIVPVAHSYWETCDAWYVLPSGRPCLLERLQILAPGDAVVRDVDTRADGFIVFEGPPGLTWHFGHVTPAPGISPGVRVTAGQFVATMFQTNGFDFGVMNPAITHHFLAPERYSLLQIHAQHPVDQFPEPQRSELLSRIVSLTEPKAGRITFDVAGSASGYWVMAGNPTLYASLPNWGKWLVLTRYVERQETRIVSLGTPWPGGNTGNFLSAVDESAPSWEDITPPLGSVALKLWGLGADARPDMTRPAGTLLIEVRADETIRVEWFDTHGVVGAFTAAARIFER
jgi:hypothetical protein